LTNALFCEYNTASINKQYEETADDVIQSLEKASPDDVRQIGEALANTEENL